MNDDNNKMLNDIITNKIKLKNNKTIKKKLNTKNENKIKIIIKVDYKIYYYSIII